MNSARLLLLRAALKKEELRLQSAANQVARIASGLEMEVAARANIDASLSNLRKQLKQDAENMATMQRMADLAMEELKKKDEDLAGRARDLNGTMRQFTSLAAAAGAAGAASGGSSSLLDLKSQLALDAGGRLGGLFGLPFDKAQERLNAIPGELNGLMGDTSAMYEHNGPGASVLAGAGIAGAASVAAGAAAVSAMTGLWDSTTKQKQSGTKKTSKKKGLFSGVGSAIGGAWNWAGDKLSDAADYVGDKVSDAADYVGDKFSDAVDYVGEKLSDAKDAVVSGAKWVGDKAGDVWDGMKKVAGSKPVQYVLDMGGSVVGTAADVGSFCGHVLTGRWDLAAIDTYSVVDNFFDFSQDLTALTAYGLGAGLDAFGVNADKVQYCYDYAEDYANREGLAGEVGAAGWDAGETTLKVVDLGVGAYKFGGGLAKFKNSWSEMKWDDMGDLKDNLLSLSGWKTGDSLEGLAGIEKKIEQYDIISSNVELGYKYVDGLVENIGSDGGVFEDGGLLGDGGLINTMAKNTTPGKLIDAVFKSGKGIADLDNRIKENSDSTVGSSGGGHAGGNGVRG